MAVNVTQSPSYMTKMTMDSSGINCSHDNPLFDRMQTF